MQERITNFLNQNAGSADILDKLLESFGSNTNVTISNLNNNNNSNSSSNNNNASNNVKIGSIISMSGGGSAGNKNGSMVATTGGDDNNNNINTFHHLAGVHADSAQPGHSMLLSSHR